MYPIPVTLLLILGLGFFVYSITIRMLPLIRAGSNGENRFSNIGIRIKAVLVLAFGQKRLLFREGKSGLMHAFIFWGFLAVALRTLLLFGQGLDADFGKSIVDSSFGTFYSWFRNIF